MMIDLLAHAGDSMESAAEAVLAVATVSVAAMAAWEWFRARVIEQWDRDYHR
jgi:hypothetical protein